jgi:Na+/melibiose symporter-like transporter
MIVPRYFAYGLPALPLAALTLPVSIFLPTYYAQEIGLGLALTGFILLLARVFDVITDPLIGYLSDKTKHKQGRRRIWIFAGTPIVMLASWFLLIPPDPSQGQVGATYLLVWSIILYAGWTMVILPLMALGAELSESYAERARISGIREMLVLAGLLISLCLIAIDSARALTILVYFIIALLPLCVLIFWRFVTEPLPIFASKTHNKSISFREGGRVLAGNKPFRHLLGAYIVNGFANALPATLFILFVTHVLGMSERAGLLLLIYFLSGLCGVPFWLWLARRFNKHKAWCFAMVWACMIFLLVPICLLVSPEAGFWIFLTICILTGLSLGADLTLPAAMQADVVDIDRLETGERRTGIYFALWSMASKLSLALAAGFAFPVLELFGFANGQSGSLWMLVFLYALLPVLLKAIAIKMMWCFPLGEDIVAQTQRDIQKRWVE